MLASKQDLLMTKCYFAVGNSQCFLILYVDLTLWFRGSYFMLVCIAATTTITALYLSLLLTPSLSTPFSLLLSSTLVAGDPFYRRWSLLTNAENSDDLQGLTTQRITSELLRHRSTPSMTHW